jgi:hypothetical protein
MKKKLQVNTKTLKNLRLKLKELSDRKIAPSCPAPDPSNGSSC